MIFYEILLFYAFFMKNMKVSNFYVFLWFYDSCDACNYDNSPDNFMKFSLEEQGPKIIAILSSIINAKTRELTLKREN